MKKLIALALTVLTLFTFTGCRRPYDKPEFQTISASQTGFLVSLVGDTGTQAAFDSEELLLETKVATKEVQIPHRTSRGHARHHAQTRLYRCRLLPN